MTGASVALFAKTPRAGRVKTRLVPPLTHEDAARVAHASIVDTMRRIVPSVSARWTLFLEGERDEAIEALAKEHGVATASQRGEDLGERLWSAFQELRLRSDGAVLAIGSDSPTLDPQRIEEAIEALQVCDVVLGPTEDGGYYLIGMSGDHGALFRDIPWSSGGTAAVTLERARERSLEVRLLAPWYDLDDPESLARARGEITSEWALHEVLEGIGGKLGGFA